MEKKKYIHYGHRKFDRDLFVQPRNICLGVKPGGGLWASPVDAEYGWKEWNNDEHFRLCSDVNSFTFTLRPGARVLLIENKDMLKQLPQMDHMFFEWVCLDFEELIRQGYDAVELNLSADQRLYWCLYGWDCDSIVILNPDIVVEEENV